MRNLFFIIGAICLAEFSACSRSAPGIYTNPTLVGKWVLTKSCDCSSCTDTIPFYKSQTIVFSVNGQVDLYGSVGNSEQHYSGSYLLKQQAYGEILSIDLNIADSNKSFLYIPGSMIQSETGASLVLELNAPFSNPCSYVNTYTAVPN